MRKNKSHMMRIWAIFCLFLFLSFTALCHAEDDKSDFKLFTELDTEYTDNVYGMTDEQISKMNENDPDDLLNGRYADMDSMSDYIIAPRIGIRWDTAGLFGGDLKVSSWLRYNLYTKNSDSSYPEVKVELKNSAGKKGAVILEGSFLYGYRKKNYLSAVNDSNGNENISGDERIYSEATYDEYEFRLGYRHEFIDDKDEILSGFDIEPFSGYSVRSYNSLFQNRDKDTFFGGLKIGFEFLNKIDLGITYKYEDVSSPGNTELILFDETINGEDVNGDGSVRRNAPLYTAIDRSADRYSFEITPSVKITKDIKFFTGYSKRTTEYSSGNSLDLEHFNQKAYRKKYKAGINYDLSKSLSAELEYCRTKNQDPEDGTYNENSYQVGLKYIF